MFNAYNNLSFPLSQVVAARSGRRATRTRSPRPTAAPSARSSRPTGRSSSTARASTTRPGCGSATWPRGEERWLKLPVQRDEQESRYTRDLIPGYAFTPDGKSVLAAYGGKIHGIDARTGEDRVIPFSAKVSQPVGSRLNFPIRVDDGPVRARLIQDPEPSPDGKHLAFSALTRLYLMDLPGGKPRPGLGRGLARVPPELVARRQVDRLRELVARRAATSGSGPATARGEPTRLTRAAAFYRDPVWSPDGKRIVALRAPRREHVENPVDFGPTAGLDLVWVPADGGDATLISPARGASRPHFAGEPDRIYVTTPGGLVSMRYDGTDRRTHLSVVGKTAYRPERARARRRDPAPPRRPMGAGPRPPISSTSLAMPAFGGEAPKVAVHEPSVPLKKLTDIGADYAAWADGGKTIIWAVGSSVFRLPFDSVVFTPLKAEEAEKDEEAAKAEKEREKPKPEEIAVVVERPRHRPRGHDRAPRGEGRHDARRRGDRRRRRRRHRPPDRGRRARRDRSRCPRGRRSSTSPGRRSCPASSTPTPTGGDPPRRARHENWSFFANLAYGVTTGRDPQTVTNDMFAYQDLVEAGELVGPRAFSTGPGVFSDTDFQSAEEVEAVVAKYKKYYRTNTLKSYMIGNRKQRQWMIEACRKNQVMPTTEGGLDLKLNLTHAIDGFSGNEHSLPVVPLFADVVELFARTGISYTPTLLVAYGGPFGETHFFTTTDDPRRPEDPPVHPARGPRRQGPALGVVPQGRARLSRGSPPRRRRSRGPAGTSASAATARCRASATTGRCGRWPAAAGSRWKSSAPPRSTAPRRSATPRTSAASRPASSPTSSCWPRTRSRTSTTRTRSAT